MSPTPPSVTRNRIDWAGLGWLFLFFWFFSGITQLLLLTSGNSGFSGFRNAMVLSTIWLAPVLLFPRWTKPLAAVIGLVLWAASLVGLSYFGIYHQEFSQSVIFVMFESNTAEASEYFSQYFNPWMTLGLVLYSLVAILLWRRLRQSTCRASAPAGGGAADRRDHRLSVLQATGQPGPALSTKPWTRSRRAWNRRCPGNC